MSILLNQKEEVISLELTSHGRKKLGMGHFQPKYFSFFDDEIIYDQAYNKNTVEDVNEIEGRILDSSLSFRSANLLEDYLTNPLGSSDVFNDYAPSWDLEVIKGSILGYDSLNSNFHKKIFNFKNIQYSLSLAKEDEREQRELLVNSDYILLDLKELNIDSEIQNFEIEIFSYDEFYGGKDASLEIQMQFDQPRNNIIDGILYDEEELQSSYYKVKTDPKDISYFYDVLVDDEIDRDFIVLKARQAEPARQQDIYKSDNSRTPETEKVDC